MIRRRIVLPWIALAGAVVIGQAAPPKPAKPIELTVGIRKSSTLVKGDPIEPGCGRCKTFRFVAPEDGECTIDASSMAFDVMVIARDKDGNDLFSPSPRNGDEGPGDGERFAIPVTKGESCFVLVVSTSEGDLGEFEILVSKGAAPLSTAVADWKDDLRFFRDAFDFNVSRKRPARAADVARKAAETALQLGREVEAEELIKMGRAVLKESTRAVSDDERELTEVRFQVLEGEIAQQRLESDVALARFAEVSTRCRKAIDSSSDRRSPDESRWRGDFERILLNALVAQYEINYFRNDWDAALVAARKAVELEERSGAPNIVLGRELTMRCALLEVLDRSGRFDEARQLEPDCAARVDRSGDPLPPVLIPYCRFLLHRARYAEAIDRLRAALGRAEEAGEDRFIVEFATELCAAHLELGNYAEVQEMAERMLQAAKSVGDDVSQGAALLYRAKSKLEQTLVEPARSDADEALRILRAAKADLRCDDALVTLMRIDIEDGKLDDAVKRMAEIGAHHATAGRPDEVAIEARIEFGSAHLEKAMAAGSTSFDKAVDAFKQALHDAETIGDRENVAIARANLGEVADLQGEHGKACELSRQAADELRALGRFERMQFPLQTIARSALAAKNPELARDALNEAEKSVENPTVAGLLGSSAADLRVQLWRWSQVAQELVSSKLAAAGDGQKADKEKAGGLYEEGVRAAWRWKARAILAGIEDHARGRGKQRSATWMELKEQLARQDRESTNLAAAYRRSAAATEIDALKKRVADSAAHARELKEKILGARPSASDADALKVEELRRAVIGPDVLLIEYVSGLDRLYAYAIDSKSIERFELGSTAKLESDAEAYRDLLSRARDASMAKEVALAGSALYRSLLEPILGRESVKQSRLLIAPTARLGALPFDALVMSCDAKGGAPGFRDIRYVLEPFTVSNVPSGAVAYELARQAPRGRQGRWLLVGAPPETDDANAVRGPGPPALEPAASTMIRELTSVAGQLTADKKVEEQIEAVGAARSGSVSGPAFELRLGQDATRSVLGDDLSEFAVLHFACHGEFDRRDPRNTVLRLAQSKGDPGRLSALDVLELRLDADLTILSACASARGRGVDGDGEQSLARAFLVAGSRAVVATLWPVYGGPTSEIMLEFEKGAGAAPTASAPRIDIPAQLRAAKLKNRRSNKGDTPPMYWAGVVCFGVGPKE